MTLAIQFEMYRLLHKLLIDDPQLASDLILLVDVEHMSWLPISSWASVGWTHERCGLCWIALKVPCVLTLQTLDFRRDFLSPWVISVHFFVLGSVLFLMERTEGA